jgi:hypothetical protein
MDDTHCADCGALLADVCAGPPWRDDNGNAYCCADCRSDALAAAWEAGAYPFSSFSGYRDLDYVD